MSLLDSLTTDTVEEILAALPCDPALWNRLREADTRLRYIVDSERGIRAFAGNASVSTFFHAVLSACKQGKFDFLKILAEVHFDRLRTIPNAMLCAASVRHPLVFEFVYSLRPERVNEISGSRTLNPTRVKFLCTYVEQLASAFSPPPKEDDAAIVFIRNTLRDILAETLPPLEEPKRLVTFQHFLVAIEGDSCSERVIEVLRAIAIPWMKSHPAFFLSLVFGKVKIGTDQFYLPLRQSFLEYLRGPDCDLSSHINADSLCSMLCTDVVEDRTQRLDLHGRHLYEIKHKCMLDGTHIEKEIMVHEARARPFKCDYLDLFTALGKASPAYRGRLFVFFNSMFMLTKGWTHPDPDPRIMQAALECVLCFPEAACHFFKEPIRSTAYWNRFAFKGVDGEFLWRHVYSMQKIDTLLPDSAIPILARTAKASCGPSACHHKTRALYQLLHRCADPEASYRTLVADLIKAHRADAVVITILSHEDPLTKYRYNALLGQLVSWTLTSSDHAQDVRDLINYFAALSPSPLPETLVEFLMNESREEPARDVYMVEAEEEDDGGGFEEEEDTDDET